MAQNLELRVNLSALDSLNPALKQAIERVNALGRRADSAREQLKRLTLNNLDIGRLREANAALPQLRTNLAAATTNAAALEQRMHLGTATQAEVQRAQQAVASLSNELQTAQERATALGARLSAHGVGDLGQYQAQSASMARRYERQIAYEQRLTEARQRSAQWQSRAGTAAAVGIGMTAVGAGIGYAMVGAVKEAAAFNSQMLQIGITADMTDAQIDALKRKITELSGSTGQSTQSLQEGVGFLVAAGMDKQVAGNTIQSVGKVATAYKANVEDIAKAAFTLNDTLKIDPGNMQGALAIMAKAGKEGNVELRDMAKVFPVLGASMASLKMQGPEAVASLAAALQIARKGSASADEAATNAQNFFAKIMSPATLKKAKEKFGVDLADVVKKAQASGANPIEAAILKIQKMTKGGDQQLLGQLFEDMQVQNFLKPMLQNFAEYKRIKAEALGASGGELIDTDLARVRQDTAQQIEEMSSAADNLKRALGDAFSTGGDGSMLKTITTALNDTRQWVAQNPKLASTLMIVAGAMAVILVVLGSLALAFAAVVVPISMVSVAMTALNISMLPLTLIVLGIAAVIAALIALWVYWDEIVACVKGWIAQYKPYIALLLACLGPIGMAIAAFMYWDEIVDYVKTKLAEFGALANSVWLGIKTACAAVWPAIVSGVTWSINLVCGYFERVMTTSAAVWTAIVSGVTWSVNLVCGYFERVMTTSTDLWGRIKTAWANFSLYDVGANIVQGLIDGMSAAGARVVGAIVGLVNSAVAAAKSVLDIKSPSRVFAAIGAFTAIGMAQGIESQTADAVGSMQRMSSRVATAGADGAAFAPRSFGGGTGFGAGGLGAGGLGGASFSGSGASFSGGGKAAPSAPAAPVTITINIHSNQDPQQIARAVQAELARAQRSARNAREASFFDGGS